MTEKISFAIDNVDVIDESENSQFATLKIDAFASGNNRHDLYVAPETLKRTAKSILQKPLVWLFDKTTQDATTHSELEIPCGFVPADSPLEFRELEDGRTMLTVVGKLWKRYSGKLLDIFLRDGKTKNVSVEIEVYESVITGGFSKEIRDFAYYCITILGMGVVPAIPGAKADMVAFAAKEKEDYELALQSITFSKYSELDFKIPESIKKNSLKGLELHKTHNLGGTGVSLTLARHLSKNDDVSPDKVRLIHKYLKSHVDRERDDKTPDGEYVSWMLHGGSDAYQWSKKLVEDLDEIDKRRLSFFTENNSKEEMAMPDVEEKKKLEEEQDKKEEKMAEEEMPVEKPEEKKEEMAAEKPEEKKEEEEEKTEEKEEKPEEKMSLDNNLDVKAMLAMIEGETEDYQKLCDMGEGVDFGMLSHALYKKMCKMSEEGKAYMSELEGLRKFKADVDAEKFMYAVESTLKDVSDVLPHAELEKAREQSKDFSIDTIDAWKNGVKALAFSFTKNEKKPEDNIVRMGLPFSNESRKNTSSPWVR